MVTQVRELESVKTYKVLLSHEDGVWLIEAPGLQGVRSYGRTVSAAARNIREAIAAAEDLDEWHDLDLVITVEDEAVSEALERFHAAKRSAEEASSERETAVKSVIGALRAGGMSYRDIGTVVGLSHQRIAQIDSEAHV